MPTVVGSTVTSRSQMNMQSILYLLSIKYRTWRLTQLQYEIENNIFINDINHSTKTNENSMVDCELKSEFG